MRKGDETGSGEMVLITHPTQAVSVLSLLYSEHSVCFSWKTQEELEPSAQGETKAISQLPGQGAPIWASRGQLGLVPVLEVKALPVAVSLSAAA